MRYQDSKASPFRVHPLIKIAIIWIGIWLFFKYVLKVKNPLRKTLYVFLAIYLINYAIYLYLIHANGKGITQQDLVYTLLMNTIEVIFILPFVLIKFGLFLLAGLLNLSG